MTTLTVEDYLINEAVQLGHHKSPQEAVIKTLKHYIQDLKQKEILELFSTVEFDSDYDHKPQREHQ